VPNYLIQPKADFDLDPDDISGAVWSVGTTDPTTISGLTNGTEYVAREFILSPASAGFTPSGGLTSSGAIALAAATVAGTAERILTASGAVTLASTTTAGTAARGLTSSGAVSVPAITTAGTATAGGAFTPADLFTGSDAGFWYDPSDLSTLWQDTAGTTAVTADGQSVARVDDKSGNGNNALQATAGNRPLYKVSSGIHWIAGDGVDDAIDATLSAITGNIMYVIAAFWPEATSGGDVSSRLAGFGQSGTEDWDETTSFNLSRNSRTNSIRIERKFASASETPSLTAMNIVEARTTASSLIISLDGGTETTASHAHGALNITLARLFANTSAVTTENSNWRLHGILAIDRVPTSTERSDLITWFADKQGRVL